MSDPILAALARALITETQGTVALNLGAVEAAMRAPRLIEALAAEGLVLVVADRLAALERLHRAVTVDDLVVVHGYDGKPAHPSVEHRGTPCAVDAALDALRVTGEPTEGVG